MSYDHPYIDMRRNQVMDKRVETVAEVESRKKKEARASFWFGIFFGGMIVLMIAGMVAIELYGESHSGLSSKAPADAADR